MALFLGHQMLKMPFKNFADIAIAVIQMYLEWICISKSFYQLF